jgi:hypothetical protein
MPLINSIPINLSNLPLNSKTVDASQKLTVERERFDNDTFQTTDSLANRSFPSFLYNPDFNILGSGGYTPITQGDGTDVQLVSNWYLSNGGGTNAYTITPTPYPSGDKSPSGSLNYLNFNVTSMDSPLYLYNLNYSTGAQQFNAASKYNGQLLSLSMAYRNNTANSIKVRFSADIPVLGESPSYAFTLQPDSFFSGVNIQIPNLGATNLGTNPKIQFRFKLENLYGAPVNFDLFYLKGEVSDSPTLLQFDHILEQLRCQNLT